MVESKLLEYDFSREVILESEIQPIYEVDKSQFLNSKKIFLTGGTGFLGFSLLKELLFQTNAKLYCLCRKQSLNLFDKKLNSLGSLKNRIIILEGDLKAPLLGMKEKKFKALAESLDLIYHSGASVSVNEYEEMKLANINGTKEVLRLACMLKTKPICYVSTLGVYMSLSNMNKDLLDENGDLESGVGLIGGYTQSKWVAEKIMIIAKKRGLPVCIVRPGRLVESCEQNESISPKNSFFRLLSLLYQKKSAPNVELQIGAVPIELVSKFMCYCMKNSLVDQTFNLVNPSTITIYDIINCFHELNVEIQLKPYSSWVNSLGTNTNTYQIFTSKVYKNLSYFQCMKYFPDGKFSSNNILTKKLNENLLSFPDSLNYCKKLCLNLVKENDPLPT